jgi:hypothetical protein
MSFERSSFEQKCKSRKRLVPVAAMGGSLV